MLRRGAPVDQMFKYRFLWDLSVFFFKFLEHVALARGTQSEDTIALWATSALLA